MLAPLLPLLALSTLSTLTSAAPSTPPPRRRLGLSPRQAASNSSSSSGWSLEQKGQTGVAAMQIAVVSEEYILIVDKVEDNGLLDSKGRPAWSALYDISKNEARALDLVTNSFCAGGSFLSNGTMVNLGGDPTESAGSGNKDGTQGVRILDGCEGGPCKWIESPERLRMAVSRWYASITRLPDGALLIAGGMKMMPRRSGFINGADVDQPSFEFFPPRGDGRPVDSKFLVDSLNSNLFPISFVLPNGLIFMAANNMAMLYDPETNVERRLPSFPKGVRVSYPRTGTGVLLPLSEENNWKPEVLICGGSTLSESLGPRQIKSTDPASDLCFRMILTNDEIEKGWREEKMSHGWMMPDVVTLPNGKILFVNGCEDGVAGYGNVLDTVGQSNCATAVYQGALYDPAAPSGSRFSSIGLPTSDIARGYHSTATLIPDGRVFIAGSNPNLNVVSNVLFPTEYRVEYLSPPYLSAPNRTNFEDLPQNIEFGSTFELTTEISMEAKNVKIALMDLGFATHSVHMNARLVYLPVQVSEDRKTLTVSAPIDGRVYPPGPGFVFVIVDGVPSKGQKVMVGDGKGPKVDEAAIQGLLSNTAPPPP